MNSLAPVQKKSIGFRARSFVAFALAPEAPLDDWLERLDRWTENSRGFFTGRPVVLDLAALRPTVAETKLLVSQLSERGIRIYAVEGADDLGPDLPPLLTGAKEAGLDEKLAQLRDNPAAEPSGSNSLIVRSPIRSGQSIFHPQGDVVVLGSVGSGSEIIAGGSVHIYGTVRGRIFAGATGNPDALIFCRRNEAELLAVDGWYLTADDMEPSARGGAVQAFLERGLIQITALS